MRTFHLSLACLSLLTICASGAFAAVINPENFESYPLAGGVYNLTAGDSWSSDLAGVVDPVAANQTVVAGQMLQLDIPGDQNTNNDIFWQQKVFTDSVQTLSYDTMLHDAGDQTWAGGNRSMVNPDKGSGSTVGFIAFVCNASPAAIALHNGNDFVQSWDAASLDTWYSVQVNFDSGAAQSVKMRYKAAGGSWSDWSATGTMSADPDGQPIMFTANDRVYFDNISLTKDVPEPSSIVLLASALVGLLVYAWRKN